MCGGLCDREQAPGSHRKNHAFNGGIRFFAGRRKAGVAGLSFRWRLGYKFVADFVEFV
jgi:hypothetical protein